MEVRCAYEEETNEEDILCCRSSAHKFRPEFGHMLRLPKLPDFPKQKCDDLLMSTRAEECCGSSAITIIAVLLMLLLLAILLILVLRHWKRTLSRVAFDIGNVTGTRKTSTEVKLISFTRSLSRNSNGVSRTASKKAHKDTVLTVKSSDGLSEDSQVRN